MGRVQAELSGTFCVILESSADTSDESSPLPQLMKRLEAGAETCKISITISSTATQTSISLNSLQIDDESCDVVGAAHDESLTTERLGTAQKVSTRSFDHHTTHLLLRQRHMY